VKAALKRILKGSRPEIYPYKPGLVDLVKTQIVPESQSPFVVDH
jgi:hypothetical protein